MNGNRFPIQKGVACPLKWGWHTLRLSESRSCCCHRVDAVPITVENFDNFHNAPVWVEHRKLQLDGKFPQQGCQYCEHIEKQGGTSDRLLHMTDPALSLGPPELLTDPEAVHVTPRVLEVFLNNTCNLACIYCNQANSSRIMRENQKFGHIIPGEIINAKPMISVVPTTTDYPLLVDKFFQYLNKNYSHLRSLNILGGEPFYQKEFPDILDFIIKNKNQDLTFTVVSNLMVSSDAIESFVSKMKYALVNRRLKRIDITASIDCFGPESEYVRDGLKLDVWTKNFEYLLGQKWLYVSINNTITNLTIKTLPELLKYVNELRKVRHIHHAFGLVDGKAHLHPKIFGPGFFESDFEKILALMPKETTQDYQSYDYMVGLIKSVNADPADYSLQHNLKCYLNELDRRRNRNWRLIFPWLVEVLDNVV